MARVLLPLAEGFEEIEAVTVVDLLRRAGIEVRTASLAGRQVTGSHGIRIEADITLDAADVAVLKRRARESYGGNLSAAFGEAARWIRQREARQRLVGMLGGQTLTPAIAAAIDAEQTGEAGQH